MEETIALKKFKDGYNCAQSVLYHYAERIGIDSNVAIRIATGFGAGMGRMQETCGAITGGIIAINQKYGRNEDEEKEKQEIAYKKVAFFMSEFEKQNGSCNCQTLLDNIDLRTEEGQKEMKERQLIKKCYHYVNSAATILEEII